MTHPLTKKARGYCPHLDRDHSIQVVGKGNLSSFTKTEMTCTHASSCATANESCPIYQKV